MSDLSERRPGFRSSMNTGGSVGAVTDAKKAFGPSAAWSLPEWGYRGRSCVYRTRQNGAYSSLAIDTTSDCWIVRPIIDRSIGKIGRRKFTT
jgi:hypothetical protein